MTRSRCIRLFVLVSLMVGFLSVPVRADEESPTGTESEVGGTLCYPIGTVMAPPGSSYMTRTSPTGGIICFDPQKPVFICGEYFTTPIGVTTTNYNIPNAWQWAETYSAATISFFGGPSTMVITTGEVFKNGTYSANYNKVEPISYPWHGSKSGSDVVGNGDTWTLHLNTMAQSPGMGQPVVDTVYVCDIP